MGNPHDKRIKIRCKIQRAKNKMQISKEKSFEYSFVVFGFDEYRF